jgi:hypothetical protein
MKNINQLFVEVEQKIPQIGLSNSSISKSSVAWHLAHILLTISQISLALKRSKPEDFKKQFSLVKLIVFATHKIPRGKAKAPQQVQPSEDITVAYLEKNLERAKKLVSEVNDLDAKSHIIHPFFKTLDLKSTLKFLNIHTQHHLTIIDDIISSHK